MDLRFSWHALQRMNQRRVDRDTVLATLESPDEAWTGDEGEEIAVRNFGVYTVRVVYEERELNVYVIITVIRSKIGA